MKNIDRDLTLLRLGAKLHFHDINQYEFLQLLTRIKRYAKKHKRLCEMSCNGEGYIRGMWYFAGLAYGQKPDAYTRNMYGTNVRSAYLSGNCEDTFFDLEAQKVQDKIISLCRPASIICTFQSDPRGLTVSLTFDGINIDNLV